MEKKKLWEEASSSLNASIESYTVGEDYMLDKQLLPYDIEASIAHASMLFRMGILTAKELQQAKEGLQNLQQQCKEGTFTIALSQEDGHTAIEQYLTEHYGDVGKKIHTGRSRNDQSLVMLRLFMKDKMASVLDLLSLVASTYSTAAARFENVPMPGYTHMQKAMPTTVAMWLGSFEDAFTDSADIAGAVLRVIDQNPLGSASGFGISNFPLERAYTTQHLGFSRTQENPMYCGLSRGYFESFVLQALSSPMILAGRFATDMLLFTTQEFNFFFLPSSFVTGSSIMPQKKNYDVFEIMRANASIFNSYQQSIYSIISSIGSGYQRDLQLTKKPFVQGVSLCLQTLEVLAEMVGVLEVNRQKIESAMTEDLFVTNQVYELVQQGKTFRDAYIEIKKQCK